MQNLLRTHNTIGVNTLVKEPKEKKTTQVELMYLEGQSNYSIMHFQDQAKKVSRTLKALTDDFLDNNFFRIHKSYIVNINYIKAFIPKEKIVLLANDTKLPISRRQYPSIRKVMESKNIRKYKVNWLYVNGKSVVY